ncbi:hypothetical protein BJV74DRAFT_889127 [Russula compacta]|nr:hypothetical protein BJV74DRAFT_889127 [Russula compacta]
MKAHIDLLGYSDSDGDYTVEVERLEPQPEAMKKKPSGSEQSAVSGITEATELCHSSSVESLNNADEWEPQAGAAAESQSSESEEDMDLEDEEPDTVIKKSGKKQKAGVGMRDCINKAAAGLTQRDISLNLEVQKWKAGSDSEVGARPTQRKAWKTKGSEPAGTTHTSAKSTATISHPPSSMVSTSTAHSCHAAFTAMSIRQANSSAPSATNDLPLDEEEVRPQDPKLVNKHQSITRVHKIHTSPLRTKAKVSQQADSNTGHHQVKNSDLLPHTIGHFTKDVLPLAFEVTGTLHPWEYPSDEQIIAIWNLVFENDHPIVSSDVKGELFLAVKGLVKQGISTWLHKFAIAAEGALVAEFEQ